MPEEAETQTPPRPAVEKKRVPKVGTTIEDLKRAHEAGLLETETETESESLTSLLTTAPFDARFPNTNQTRACWQYYVDSHKCARAKAEEGGTEHPGCKKLARLARIMCPKDWMEKWNTALEEGRNPSDMTPPTL